MHSTPHVNSILLLDVSASLRDSLSRFTTGASAEHNRACLRLSRRNPRRSLHDPNAYHSAHQPPWLAGINTCITRKRMHPNPPPPPKPPCLNHHYVGYGTPTSQYGTPKPIRDNTASTLLNLAVSVRVTLLMRSFDTAKLDSRRGSRDFVVRRLARRVRATMTICPMRLRYTSKQEMNRQSK